MTCRLRPASPADLPSIVAIYNASIPGRKATADLQPLTVDDRRDWFTAHQTPACPLWVAVDATQAVIGWVALSEFYGRAAYKGTREVAVYVAPGQQGQGVATALVQQALQEAQALQLHTLVAYVFSHNTASVRLFQKCGFELWGHCPDIARLDGNARSLDILGLTLIPAAASKPELDSQ